MSGSVCVVDNGTGGSMTHRSNQGPFALSLRRQLVNKLYLQLSTWLILLWIFRLDNASWITLCI